jgi:hypothetical protein
LAGLKPGNQDLYSDPQVGYGELRRLVKTKVIFTTPLKRMAKDQSLRWKLIALITRTASAALMHLILPPMEISSGSAQIFNIWKSVWTMEKFAC